MMTGGVAEVANGGVVRIETQRREVDVDSGDAVQARRGRRRRVNDSVGLQTNEDEAAGGRIRDNCARRRNGKHVSSQKDLKSAPKGNGRKNIRKTAGKQAGKQAVENISTLESITVDKDGNDMMQHGPAAEK